MGKKEKIALLTKILETVTAVIKLLKELFLKTNFGQNLTAVNPLKKKSENMQKKNFPKNTTKILTKFLITGNIVCRLSPKQALW